MTYACSIRAVDDEPVATRMRDLFLHASDLIGTESVPYDALPSHAQFDTVCRRLLDLISSPQTSPARRAEGYELLGAMQQVQDMNAEAALELQLGALSHIRDSVSALSGMTPRELIDSVPVRVCSDLSMGRAMISTVRGSTWLPQHLYIKDRTSGSAAFEDFVDGAQIPLSDAPLEIELVRRRTVALVSDPVEDRRTHKVIVNVAQTRAYVAAPITLRGRTIGMLHADRPEDPGSLINEDLELLAAFAECVSIVFESAFIQQRLDQQIERASAMYAQVKSVTDDVVAPQTRISHRHPTESLFWHAQHVPAGTSALTPRERQVLEHLATGATNVQIARNLVVSEATVKSHLKQISKKLGTSNRAASVAAYARMTHRPHGFAQ